MAFCWITDGINCKTRFIYWCLFLCFTIGMSIMGNVYTWCDITYINYFLPTFYAIQAIKSKKDYESYYAKDWEKL
jgi:hypothetical protein